MLPSIYVGDSDLENILFAMKYYPQIIVLYAESDIKSIKYNPETDPKSMVFRTFELKS